ncbi:MAG: N-acetyl-alpha-D-glucosaminyl L-malate synthase BshA [Gemmatimonadetes bacterium]|uniref:N-acetyl-alpha-D-glucosaminyl L-malate synthase BshA n=1 Tax=Candidatus Kutchimonas denitrificans TaxID=3056748 RepID=A0AAE4ZB99_9BACT|nr:N-acetyl-alpha-D-glucosaminyl L-malate synthase BshA [Gemmatimonadota bacterium]NIR76027.1 N-acetyl-alpha-D-glucosaminyl L-malate synthase BshA [Candidatus Kutchimonas denitrificans]NIS02219.1 N-acetyl-alpha-D-glucosaminyl L-malate synthase BshA [Gemmatimonadota bacterium]NIT68045.1 N-acetyl-alpha-D-glucosaminyl L-malate synthase BshA [Gemmatimonadota bacterium]NIU54071.1 N-acetyl-alpha-D-glucosaminyl L-malate synthase BshA [Gemmatimonadota bacterium]
MKIGIACYPTYGGSGAVATELGMRLAQRGHEVHFVSYAHPFRLPRFLRNTYFHEIEVTRYPLFEYPPYSLAATVAMHEVATQRHLDLFHVHYAVPHATSALLAKQMLEEPSELKVVTTLHGTDITLVGQDPSYRSIVKFSIERSDALTAVSEYLKRETLARFGCAGCNVRVIPNFVDTDLFRHDTDKRNRGALAEPEEKILMHISNFRPVKRIEDVVRVAARTMDKVAARLVLVGDGPDRPIAEERARNLGIGDRVLFLGKQEQVAELLACADLFLLPSESESFGLSALEAMSCEVPVVGTRNGGLEEVVEDGVCGRLLPVGAVDAMSDAATQILADSELHRKMGRAGRAIAEEKFSVERIVAMYERLYGEV